MSEAATRAAHVADDTASLVLWTFVDTHARWFKQRAADYQKTHPGFSLTVHQYPNPPYKQKLLTVLQTGIGAPDLCDVEQGMFGSFVQGTVPFVPLEQRLTAGGYLKELVPAREALYTWKGHIYGIEHALCPVVLYYRADYFQKYGIKPSDLATWDDFIAAGTTLKKHGIYMLPTDVSYFEILLRQRGGDVFDAKGALTADSPLAQHTLQWLMDLQTKHQIAKPPAGLSIFAPQAWAELQKGTFATQMGADWWAGFLHDNAGTLAGKWRAMPLPVWAQDATKRPTSCSGGTGLAIPITTSKQAQAWDFARFCLLTTAGEVQQFEMIQLFPPFSPAWKDKALHTPNAYMGGQDLGALFAEVGKHVPPEYQSPFRADFETFTGADAPLLLQGKTSPAAWLKTEAGKIRAEMKK
jgi:ABC-type glycerol-3-phosphate transport system substrate-binding protein